MKFQFVCAIALCFCFGQICSAANEYTEKKISQIKEYIQKKIHGVSEQFIEDVTTILDYKPSDPYVIEMLRKDSLVFMISGVNQKQNSTKFDVDDRGYDVNEIDLYYPPALQSLDNYKILQSTLSKQFPPERYNGIVNLFYVNFNPNATAEELASVVNYLRGTNDAARKTSYIDLHHFPGPVGADCPRTTRKYSRSIDKLKSMIDVKPKVAQDFASIQEKFQCNGDVAEWIHGFLEVIVRLGADKSKINACMRVEDAHPSNDRLEHYLKEIESILSTRLPDETFRGQLNVIGAFGVDAPKDEIEKALEYLYDDVPKADC